MSDPTTPTPASIVATLQQNLSAQGQLALAADAFGDGILTALFDTFLSDKTLTLTQATVTATSDGATVAGLGGGDLAGTHVQADFTVTGGIVTFVLHAVLPAGWKLSAALPALAGTIIDELPVASGTLILQTDDQGAVGPHSLLFDADINLNASFGTYGWLLGSLTTARFSGVITVAAGVPSFTLTCPLSSGLTVGTLKQLPLSLALTSKADESGTGATASLLAVSSLALPVGSTPTLVPLTMNLAPGANTGELDADLSALKTVTLDVFTNLVGGLSLASILPGGSPFKGDSAYTESTLTFDLSFPKATGTATMPSVKIEVGMPAGASWTLFNGMTASELRFVFTVTDPAGSPALSGGFHGELAFGTSQPPVLIDVDATAVKSEATIKGQLHPGTTTDLKALVTHYVPSADWLPALSLDTLNLDVAYKDQATTAQFAAALSSDWKIAVGPASLSITSVSADLNYAASALTGTVTGKLGLDTATFTVTCAVPGGLKIEGAIPTITLSALQRALTNAAITLPPGFDLTLTDSTMVIESADGNLALRLGTRLGGVGSLEFVTTRQGAQWGFALGLQLAGGKLADLPGLSALAIFEQTFGIKNPLLVVASQAASNFTFPALPASLGDSSLLSPAITLPPQAGGLQRGFNFYATIDLQAAAITRPLASLLHLSTAAVTLVVGPNPAANSSLTASVTGNITSAMPLTGSFTIQSVNSVLGFLLKGSIPATIQGQAVTFNATMEVVGTGGALLAGDATGTVDFHVVTLANLALAIGINAAGIPSIGVAATISGAQFDSSIAVFFDSVTPSQSMFLGAVSDLDLGAILKTFAGAVGQPVPPPINSALQQITLKGLKAASIPAAGVLAASLDNGDVPAVAKALAAAGLAIPSEQQSVLIISRQKGRRWSLTDLTTQYHYQLTLSGDTMAVNLAAQVYCAPQQTKISTLVFPQGIHLSGELSLFGLTATAQVDVSTNRGISIDTWMTPVKVLGGSVLSITDATGARGPFLSLATYTNPAQTDPKKQPPHLFLSGNISMLGISQQSVDATVTTGGLFFTLNTTSGPASYSVNATVASLSSISASGSASIQVGTLNLGPLGSLPLNTGVGLTLGIGYNGSAVTGKATGQASLLGQAVGINLGVGVSGNTLADLPGQLVGFLETQAKNLLLGNVNTFLNAVKSGALQGFGDAQKVGQVLGQQFRLSPNDIASQTKNALGYGVDQVAGALKGAGVSPDQIGNILLGMGYTLNQITGAIQKWFSGVRVNFSLPHIDTNIPPHGDTNPHIDTPRGPHVDSHVDRWGFSKHGDSAIPPHGDRRQHIDTPSVHTDIGQHIDLG